MTRSRAPIRLKKVEVRANDRILPKDGENVLDVLETRWQIIRYYSDGTQSSSLIERFPGENDFALSDLFYSGHKGGAYIWKLKTRRSLALPPTPQADSDYNAMVF